MADDTTTPGEAGAPLEGAHSPVTPELAPTGTESLVPAADLEGDAREAAGETREGVEERIAHAETLKAEAQEAQRIAGERQAELDARSGELEARQRGVEEGERQQQLAQDALKAKAASLLRELGGNPEGFDQAELARLREEELRRQCVKMPDIPDSRYKPWNKWARETLALGGAVPVAAAFGALNWIGLGYLDIPTTTALLTMLFGKDIAEKVMQIASSGSDREIARRQMMKKMKEWEKSETPVTQEWVLKALRSMGLRTEKDLQDILIPATGEKTAGEKTKQWAESMITSHEAIIREVLTSARVRKDKLKYIDPETDAVVDTNANPDPTQRQVPIYTPKRMVEVFKEANQEGLGVKAVILEEGIPVGKLDKANENRLRRYQRRAKNLGIAFWILNSIAPYTVQPVYNYIVKPIVGKVATEVGTAAGQESKKAMDAFLESVGIKSGKNKAKTAEDPTVDDDETSDDEVGGEPPDPEKAAKLKKIGKWEKKVKEIQNKNDLREKLNEFTKDYGLSQNYLNSLLDEAIGGKDLDECIHLELEDKPDSRTEADVYQLIMNQVLFLIKQKLQS